MGPVPGFRDAPVRVQVPASSANLGPGFDSFGLALALYDELEVRLAPSGLDVRVTGEGAESTREDESRLVVRALRAGLDRLGATPSGLVLHCTNRIPHGRGLGSSAAAIVAGAMGARALAVDGEEILTDQVVFDLSTELEGHPDNVAACLFGGLTVAWTDAGPHAVRLEPRPVATVAFVAAEKLKTRAARGLLPADVPHADAAANSARAALLVAALTGAGSAGAGVDLDLLLAACDDRLHQPYREPAMPGSVALVRDLRASGFPAVISGAGPTVLAFAQVGDAARLLARAPAGFVAHEIAIDSGGARILAR